MTTPVALYLQDAHAIREGIGSGAYLLAAAVYGKGALLAVVTDDLRDRGVRADALVREVAATVGGRGGGKPHMAQAGVEPAQLAQALEASSRGCDCSL